MWKSLCAFFSALRYLNFFNLLIFTFVQNIFDNIAILVSHTFSAPFVFDFMSYLMWKVKCWSCFKLSLHRWHLRKGRHMKITFHFLKLMKVTPRNRSLGEKIHPIRADTFNCWEYFFGCAVHSGQLQRFNRPTYIFTCWISLYICFDRKAGSSLFHGQ